MAHSQPADSVVILDFETTGISPKRGDRVIEVGAVKLVHGEVVDQFQQLMNPGFRISHFIETYTGIKNSMLRTAHSCHHVMREFSDFVGDANLVAHNASFDRRFLDAELDRIQRDYTGVFACSMLIARRLFQNAPNHRLGTLVEHLNIENEGIFHRALADAEMTARLWLAMLDEIKQRYSLEDIPFELMLKLAKTPKSSVHRLLRCH